MHELRIAYVVGWSDGPSSGPFKKIAAQTGAWAEQGADVGLFVLTRSEHVEAWRALPAARQVLARAAGPRLALQKERLLGAAQRFDPDVVYHRWTLAYPGLIRLARRKPVVIEVNTDDVAEYDLLDPLKGRVNRATRGLVLSRVAGLAFVTHELSRSSSFTRFGRPSTVVANGISLAEVPTTPAPENARARLLFIGAPECPWHGTDKVVELARLQPGWDIDVVGPTADELGQVPGNLTAHGVLASSDYAQLLAAADVGIGSLALHRNSLDEASPLKVREYLAAGLPVVAGYVDTDFPEGADHLLSLHNTDDNVRAGQARIEAFVGRWKGRRVPRSDVAHLDHAVKEQQRLRFLESVATQGGSAAGTG